MTTDEDRAPLTALEWLRVTHAGTLSGRRIEEALAAERERVAAPVRALAGQLDRTAETARRRFPDSGMAAAYQGAADRLRAVLPPQPDTDDRTGQR